MLPTGLWKFMTRGFSNSRLLVALLRPCGSPQGSRFTMGLKNKTSEHMITSKQQKNHFETQITICGDGTRWLWKVGEGLGGFGLERLLEFGGRGGHGQSLF